MSKLQGVVFDFDGLILDTETPEFESWGNVFRSFGVELRLQDWIACVGAGPDAWNVFDHLEALVGHPVDRAKVDAGWKVERDLLVNTLQPLPGVLELVAELEAARLPFAIASSSRRHWVVGHLTRLGLQDQFPHVFTRDEHAPKPAPDLYLAASATLGIEPYCSFAIEDSLNGIRAAYDAGLNVVAVPNSVTQILDLSLAHFQVNSIADLSLTKLEAFLNQSSPCLDGLEKARPAEPS